MNEVTEKQPKMSNAFIYGVNWDGTVLAKGQLTERMAWQMMLTSKRARAQRVIAESYLNRSIEAFRLLSSVTETRTLSSTSAVSQQVLDEQILKTWVGLAATSVQFRRVRSSSYEEGVHFMIFFHTASDGQAIANIYIVSHRELISDDTVKRCASTFFHQLAMKDPKLCPTGFIEQNPYYLK
ncbi:MAG: hypothetical protein EOO52_13540 [Gammaproteobacteria bacterium]|nr:MAG: hypothetical protein EOO52_13540 [Gammaproteobacteria bacterium]